MRKSCSPSPQGAAFVYKTVFFLRKNLVVLSKQYSEMLRWLRMRMSTEDQYEFRHFS